MKPTPMTVQLRVERKLMTRLVSMIFGLYFLFSVDRGNIGFAGLQMTKSLGLTAEVFGLGSALFTVAYLVFQVPNAVWLRRLGGGRAFAVIAFAWGAVSTLTAFVPNQTWFLINRILLGVAEAGFNAFVIYYIHQFFPPRLRGFAVGLVLVAVPGSLIIASPLSGLLLNLTVGGLQGWQWLFILEGLPTILLGFLAWRLLPASAEAMDFLSPEERRWLLERLDSAGASTGAAPAQGLWHVIANPLVWALGFVSFTTIFLVNVMLIWMPQILKQMSHASNLGVGLLNSLPWIALGLGIVLVSRVSDKIPSRVAALVPSLVIAALGFLLAAFTQDHYPILALAGLLIGSFGGGAAQGVFWALVMEVVSGPAAASAYAVITLLGNGSGVFAHPLIGRLHDLTGSFAGVAWALAGFNVLSIIVSLFIAGSLSRQARLPDVSQVRT